MENRMKTFLVSYDLKAPGRDYEAVWEYLKRTGIYWHPLGSVWLIVCDLSAGQIRDDLRALVDANDRILVIRVDGQNWASRGLDNGTEWMHSRVG